MSKVIHHATVVARTVSEDSDQGTYRIIETDDGFQVYEAGYHWAELPTLEAATEFAQKKADQYDVPRIMDVFNDVLSARNEFWSRLNDLEQLVNREINDDDLNEYDGELDSSDPNDVEFLQQFLNDIEDNSPYHT